MTLETEQIPRIDALKKNPLKHIFEKIRKPVSRVLTWLSQDTGGEYIGATGFYCRYMTGNSDTQRGEEKRV